MYLAPRGGTDYQFDGAITFCANHEKKPEKLTYSDGGFRIPVGPELCAGQVTVRDDFRRQFYAADEKSPDWTLSETVSQAKGTIRRKFRIEAQKGSAFRSISLDILLEYPGQGGGLSGWNVFTGRLDFPETIYCAGARKVYYADVCYGTVLPLLSLYHAEKNCGLTVACDPAVFPSGRLACGNTCSVLARGTGDRRWKKATFKVQESGRIAVTLDGHSNAYVLKITTVR